MGNSSIPSSLGTTVTGALSNIPFRFGIDSTTGDYGYYKVGADSVTPFKGSTATNPKTIFFTSNVSDTGASVGCITVSNSVPSISVNYYDYYANSGSLKSYGEVSLQYTGYYTGYQLTALQDCYINGELKHVGEHTSWRYTDRVCVVVAVPQ